MKKIALLLVVCLLALSLGAAFADEGGIPEAYNGTWSLKTVVLSGIEIEAQTAGAEGTIEILGSFLNLNTTMFSRNGESFYMISASGDKVTGWGFSGGSLELELADENTLHVSETIEGNTIGYIFTRSGEVPFTAAVAEESAVQWKLDHIVQNGKEIFPEDLHFASHQHMSDGAFEFSSEGFGNEYSVSSVKTDTGSEITVKYNGQTFIATIEQTMEGFSLICKTEDGMTLAEGKLSMADGIQFSLNVFGEEFLTGTISMTDQTTYQLDAMLMGTDPVTGTFELTAAGLSYSLSLFGTSVTGAFEMKEAGFVISCLPEGMEPGITLLLDTADEKLHAVLNLFGQTASMEMKFSDDGGFLNMDIFNYPIKLSIKSGLISDALNINLQLGENHYTAKLKNSPTAMSLDIKGFDEPVNVSLDMGETFALKATAGEKYFSGVITPDPEQQQMLLDIAIFDGNEEKTIPGKVTMDMGIYTAELDIDGKPVKYSFGQPEGGFLFMYDDGEENFNFRVRDEDGTKVFTLGTADGEIDGSYYKDETGYDFEINPLGSALSIIAETDDDSFSIGVHALGRDHEATLDIVEENGRTYLVKDGSINAEMVLVPGESLQLIQTDSEEPFEMVFLPN